MFTTLFVLIIAVTCAGPANGQCIPETFQYDEDFVTDIILPHVAVTYGNPTIGLANVGLQRYKVDTILETNLTGPIGNYFAFISRSDKDKRYIVAFSGIYNQSQMGYARDQMNALMIAVKLQKSGSDEGTGHAVFPVFLRAYESFKRVGLSSAIQKILKEPATSDYEVIFTGLSFGGTQAMIAGYMFSQYIFGRKANIITIASPKVGNEEFAEYINSIYPNAIRVVYNCDGVVATPLTVMNENGTFDDPKGGYHHAGIEVFYKNFTQPYQICGRENCEDASSCIAECSIWDLYVGILQYHSFYFDRWVGHWGATNLVEMWND